MDRMGHALTKAALIYLHRSGARDRAIADALSAMVEHAQKEEVADVGSESEEGQEE